MKRISERQFRRAAVKKRREHRKKKRSLLARSRVGASAAELVGATVAITLDGKVRTVPLLGLGRPVPSILCIERNRDGVLNLIYEIREKFEKFTGKTYTRRDRLHFEKYQAKNIKDYWRFEDLEEITPSAALMIAAEYHRVTLLTGLKFAAVNVSSWHPEVYAALGQIGFFDLLSISKRQRRKVEENNRRFLRFRSDEKATNDVAGAMMEELEEAAKVFKEGSPVDFERLHGALFEGLTNTKQHAHPDDYVLSFRHVGRWWATGAIDYQQRKISVVIYDQGITIPVSIARWGRLPAVQDWLGRVGIGSLSKENDGYTIAAAMEVSKSSTGQAYRGLGLAEMERFMNTCVKGSLRVRSRFGEYVANAKSETQIVTYRSELRGTLIEWELWV